MITFVFKFSDPCPSLDSFHGFILLFSSANVVLQTLLDLIDSCFDFWESLSREPQELAELIDVEILIRTSLELLYQLWARTQLPTFVNPPPVFLGII